MNTRVISQYAGEDLHYERIGQLLTEDNAYDQLRVLCAFLTFGGLQAIADPLRKFLDRGGRLDWIIGIDDVTTQEALQYLYDLAQEYPNQVDVRIFSAASSQHIFHPKVYWLLGPDKYTVIVGSANLTVGGLVSNFETSLEIEVPIQDETYLVKQFEHLWIQYSTPLLPLGPENLIDLCSKEGLKLIQSLVHEQSEATKLSNHKPHPLSQHDKGNEIRKLIKQKHHQALKRPNLDKVTTRTRDTSDSRTHQATPDLPKTLIMDIQTETRQTQVQFPVKVIKQYFNTLPSESKTILLSYVRDGEILSTHERPIIHLEHNNTHRIEIDTIRGVRRPLIIRFDRDDEDPDTYTYTLLLQGTSEYNQWSHELNLHGSQTRPGAKRWLIIS